MEDTEYSYELTVNIVAEMVLDYMSKNTNDDKYKIRKSTMDIACNQENGIEGNKPEKLMVA